MNKPYTIGLDIGTASVGYAVQYENYDLVKKKMKIKAMEQKKQSKKIFGVFDYLMPATPPQGLG